MYAAYFGNLNETIAEANPDLQEAIAGAAERAPVTLLLDQAYAVYQGGSAPTPTGPSAPQQPVVVTGAGLGLPLGACSPASSTRKRVIVLGLDGLDQEGGCLLAISRLGGSDRHVSQHISVVGVRDHRGLGNRDRP